MPRENPLAWTQSAPAAGCEIEHFRHTDGRQLRVLNPRLEMVGHEDGSPYAIGAFEAFQIFDGDDWSDPTDAEADELGDDIRRAVRHQLDWGT